MSVRNDVYQNIAAAAIAGTCQPALFNPLDCLKVRWQVRTGADKAHTSMTSFVRHIVSTEGLVRGLWLPGLHWNMAAVAVSQGLRMGLYPSIRDSLAIATSGSANSNKNDLKGVMLLSGFCSGASGYLLAAPLWLFKTEGQAKHHHHISNPTSISSTAASQIQRGLVEQIKHLWRGSAALVVRGALLSAGQMAGYDFTKHTAKV